MFKFLKRKRKYCKVPKIAIEYTECDICEHLEECKSRLIEITKLEETQQHFIRGGGFDMQNCKKYMYEHYDEIKNEMESEDEKTMYHNS